MLSQGLSLVDVDALYSKWYVIWQQFDGVSITITDSVTNRIWLRINYLLVGATSRF